MQEALASGAVGFLPKGLTVAQVGEAIRRARAGQVPVFEEELQGLMQRIGWRQAFIENQAESVAKLTPRELQILRLMGRGLSVDDIAERLKMATSTARRHVHNILDKTGARSQVEAIVIARDHRLIP